MLNIIKNSINVIFKQPKIKLRMLLKQLQLRSSHLAFAVVLTFCFIFWLFFLLKGGPSLLGTDWLKEQVFSNVLRESINSFAIPWEINEPYRHGTNLVLSNPEISLIPDFLLLQFISNNSYLVLHIIIFVIVGFYGTFLLAKKLSLVPIPLIFFTILFNCNGYITSHIAEGHIQWAGYFLFPLFFYMMLNISDQEKNEALIFRVSIILGILILNGSIHIAVWCIMFMLIGSIFEKNLRKATGKVIFLTVLFGAARLFPASIYFPPKLEYYSGFESVTNLIDALTSNITKSRNDGLGYHELDCFVGFIGFAYIIFGTLLYYKHKIKVVPNWWVISSFLLLVLSLGDVYQLVPKSGIPFASIERVSSRFIVIPFITFLTIASIAFSNSTVRSNININRFTVISIPLMLGELIFHAKKWHLYLFGTQLMPAIYLQASDNLTMKSIIFLSWTTSILSLIFYFTKKTK